MSEEEEKKKLAHLEKRLVANVDFDDQALNSLGFGMDSIICWVIRIWRLSFMRGCQVSHSGWREFSKWFPMNILGSYLVFKRKLWKK
jgi:hypothetical protein